MNNKLTPNQDLVMRYLKNKSSFLNTNKLYIQYHGTRGITVKECIDVLGTTELRKIMSQFRQCGYVVLDIWEEGSNRFGEKTRYKRYFLKRKSKNDK